MPGDPRCKKQLQIYERVLTMPYQLFHEQFPELAFKEMRSIIILTTRNCQTMPRLS
jgi:hypothetical protein